MNVDKKSLETVFLIAICLQSGSLRRFIWVPKTYDLAEK